MANLRRRFRRIRDRMRWHKDEDHKAVVKLRPHYDEFIDGLERKDGGQVVVKFPPKPGRKPDCGEHMVIVQWHPDDPLDELWLGLQDSVRPPDQQPDLPPEL